MLKDLSYCWLIILLAFTCPTCIEAVLKDYRLMSKNVSALLDSLLDKNRYDKRIRPDFGGPPATISVNMLIKSMGPVSENDEHYAMDCYFRQTWYDRRLTFDFPGMHEFSLSWLFLDRVWKPDTVFMNGMKSHLHHITVPNKFLRLRHDGFLTYSMRLTIWASCPMHLRKFPLDTQKCPLIIGSYGYRADDLVYAWQPKDKVVVEKNVELAQYDLVNISTQSGITFMRGIDEYSVVKVWFLMKRHTGYFMLQVFVPCGLIVCCSWVSFWIDPDAVPARVQLAVTTVLSMTTMGFGGRSQMPRVPYATALDWFVILCFSFVFGVMLEYAAINFRDMIAANLKKLLEEEKAKAEAAAKEAEAAEATKDLKDSKGTMPAVSVPQLVVEYASTNATKAECYPGKTDSQDVSKQPDYWQRIQPGVAVFQREKNEEGNIVEGKLCLKTTPSPTPSPSSKRQSDPIYADIDITDVRRDQPEPPFESSKNLAGQILAAKIDSSCLFSSDRKHQYGVIMPQTPKSDQDQIVDYPTRPLPPIPSIRTTPSPKQDSGINFVDSEKTSDSMSISWPKTGSFCAAEEGLGLGSMERERRKSFLDVTMRHLPLLGKDSKRRKSEGSMLTVPGQDFPCDEDNQEHELSLGAQIRGSVVDLTAFTTDKGRILKRSLSKVWQNVHILPTEEDVMTEEPPPKFSKIDIASRKIFPLAFFSLLSTYFILYNFYVTDDFPVKVYRDLMTNRKPV